MLFFLSEGVFRVSRTCVKGLNIKMLTKSELFAIFVQVDANKLRLRGQQTPGNLRAEILRRTPVVMSQMVAWQHIWWQKGVIWVPLSFQALPAHLVGHGGVVSSI